MEKIFFIVLLIIASLKSFAGEIKITANLTGFSEGAMVYLISGQTPLAYQTLSKGTVELTAEVSENPENYMIYIVDNNQPFYTGLFVADETLVITASKEDLPYKAKISGSKYHAQKVLLDDMQESARNKGSLFQKEVMALQQTEEWQKPEVQQKYVGENGLGDKLQKELKQIEADYILNYFDNAYAWSLLSHNTTAYDKTFYKAIYDKMTAEQKQTQIGQQYLLASQSKRLTKGESFIEINVLDKNLSSKKLSDYFNKDKEYILVDLSSISCPSSNQAFPITKNFTDKYADKLQAISILESPDSETYKAFGALSTDNWALVYAKNHMNSDTYIKYQENATPTFLLFDKSGKLIDRWTGSAIHQQKLEQHFSKYKDS